MTQERRTSKVIFKQCVMHSMRRQLLHVINLDVFFHGGVLLQIMGNNIGFKILKKEFC